MKKLDALFDTIKAALKRRPERIKAPTRCKSGYTIPCVAYVTVRCREYATVCRRKVIDRF